MSHLVGIGYVSCLVGVQRKMHERKLNGPRRPVSQWFHLLAGATVSLQLPSFSTSKEASLKKKHKQTNDVFQFSVIPSNYFPTIVNKYFSIVPVEERWNRSKREHIAARGCFNIDIGSSKQMNLLDRNAEGTNLWHHKVPIVLFFTSYGDDAVRASRNSCRNIEQLARGTSKPYRKLRASSLAREALLPSSIPHKQRGSNSVEESAPLPKSFLTEDRLTHLLSQRLELTRRSTAGPHQDFRLP